MYIIRDNAGQVRRVKSLEEVAQIVELDPHEIAWALEEYGRCETDTHTVAAPPQNRSRCVLATPQIRRLK